MTYKKAEDAEKNKKFDSQVLPKNYQSLSQESKINLGLVVAILLTCVLIGAGVYFGIKAFTKHTATVPSHNDIENIDDDLVLLDDNHPSSDDEFEQFVYKYDRVMIRLRYILGFYPANVKSAKRDLEKIRRDKSGVVERFKKLENYKTIVASDKAKEAYNQAYQKS